MQAKLTGRQVKARRNFSRFLDGLTLSDLTKNRIQRAVVNALVRLKQIDDDAEAIKASQLDMFSEDTDYRARMPSLIQPDLFRL